MLDVLEHACNPKTLEAEIGEPSVQGQAQLYNETLFQKEKKKAETISKQNNKQILVPNY
jgi:hypothetical protein